MVAVRIYMHKGFMRTSLRSLFSEHVDDIGIIDYRENKDNVSTNIWMECKEDDIGWFLEKFLKEYDNVYSGNEIEIKVFKEGDYFIEQGV